MAKSDSPKVHNNEVATEAPDPAVMAERINPKEYPLAPDGTPTTEPQRRTERLDREEARNASLNRESDNFAGDSERKRWAEQQEVNKMREDESKSTS